MTKAILSCDDGWTVNTTNASPEHRRYLETIFTVGNGYLASRGTFPELDDGQHSRPATYLAGLFEHLDDPMKPPRLLTLPDWTPISIRRNGAEWKGTDLVQEWRAAIYLKRGLLVRSFRWQGPGGDKTAVRIKRFASMTHPHFLCERWELTPENWSGTLTFRSTTKDEVCPQSRVQPYQIKETLYPATVEGGCSLAEGETLCLERLIRITSNQPFEPPLDPDPDPGLWTRMLKVHEAAWARFWEISDIGIEGDPESQSGTSAATWSSPQVVGGSRPASANISL